MAITLDSFMAALAGQESGGSYSAENPHSGAYGKWQIMPSNWPAWSREAGLPAGAPQTPENQEKVVRYKLQQYYDKYGNWEDVAAVWYSGQPLGANADAPQTYGGGSYPSIREYVNSVIARAGGEPGQSGGGGSVADPLTGTYEAVLAQIAAMQQNPPQPGTDEYLDWLVELSQLATIARQLKPDSSGSRDPNDTATADFQNRIQDNQLDLAFDQTTLSRAIADIDRFLGGKEESRARASQIFDAQKFLSAYGTSPGKSSFSLADLGSGFEAAGARMGLDPDKPFLNYTGTVRIDPEADMARFDAMLGATGEIPGLPDLITNPANFPDAPGLDFATDYGGGGADYDFGTGLTPAETNGVQHWGGQGLLFSEDWQLPPRRPVIHNPDGSRVAGGTWGEPGKGYGKPGRIPMPMRNPVYQGKGPVFGPNTQGPLFGTGG
ncbi:MAG: transglycosylase SLT domain-containing protein [Vicinamibacterales bacterium]